MKRSFMLLAVVAILGGCASVAAIAPPENEVEVKFKQEMDAWVGKSVDDLVVARGAPTETYILEGGRRVYEYVHVKGILRSTSLAALDKQTEQKAGVRARSAPATAAVAPDKYVNTLSANTKSKHAALPCELQFFISSGSVIERWAVEGECF